MTNPEIPTLAQAMDADLITRSDFRTADAAMVLRAEVKRLRESLDGTVYNYKQCDADKEVALAEVKRLQFDLFAARQDVVDAAGELRIALPEPGSPMAKVLTANRLLKAEVSGLKAVIRKMEEQEIGSSVDCWKHEKAARADERSKLSDSLELAKLQRDEVRDERDLLQRKYDRVVVGGNEALDRVTAERDAAQFALTNATAAHDAVSLRAANGDLAESIRRREAGIRLNSKLILGLTARKETLEADLARVTAERDGAKSALREIAYVVCGSEFYVDVNDAVEAMAKELYEAAGWVTSWGDCWNSTTVEAWRKAAKRAIELGAKTTAVKS